MASWNIEGLTDEKLATLEHYMSIYSIDLICLQETHRPNSDYWTTENGSLVILSGSASEDHEHAGVGMVVSRKMRASVIGFVQASNRFMGIKLRCTGGKCSVISAYAPQSGRPFDERLAFFQNLDWFYHRMKTHGPTLVFGDMNARLYHVFPGEEDYLGPHAILNPVQQVMS